MKNGYQAIFRIAIWLVFLGKLTAMAAPLTNAESRRIEIKTRVIFLSATNVFLDVMIENRTSNDISIPNGFLPWDRYAMTLVLVETDPASTTLKQEFTVADPLPGEPHKLGKGKRLRGTIDLTDRFPSLLNVLKRNEVILFWNYRVEGEDEITVERMGGWSLIPRLAK